MDSTASQRQQNQMSQSTRISASNGFSSDLSSPLSSMNNNEIWFNDQVQNLQQQRFRPPQAENSVMNSSLLAQPGMQVRFRPPQGGMPSSMNKSNFTPNQHDMSAIQDYQDPMIQQLMNKPSGELSAADIFQIVQLANKDIHNKIDSLANHCNTEISTLKNHVQILQSDKKKKDDEIQTLKYIITGMQRSINMIDNEERNKNAVIYGVPEEDMVVESGSLNSDEAKVKHILKLIGCTRFNEAAFRDLEIERIGKVREDYNRVMKIKCRSKEDRDELMKDSKKLKDAGEIWKKVYIKKDEHPVYLAEKSRLRQKMRELKKMDENKLKEVVIKDGKLMVDATVVDKNTFFA